MRKALFLDLGDTLVRVENDEIHADADGRIEFLPNTIDTLKRRAPEFAAVFIVTNQSGIEKGYLPIERSISYIDQVDDATGGLITDFWACPMRESPYRKPNPGMLTGLADKHFIDLGRSLMVGDSAGDRQAAAAAGIGQFIHADTFFGR